MRAGPAQADHARGVGTRIVHLQALAVAILAPLAVPALAGAATQVSVQQVQGLNVVVAVDDDGPAQIQTTLGIDSGTQQHFVAVQSAGGATPGTGCQTATATIVGCTGDFAAIVVFGNGGNDTITMTLIADGLPPLHGEAYGGAGDDTLKSPPDTRDVPQPETYIDGEAGNDTIVSGNGQDELHGGDGNDTMQAFEGPDVVRGEGGDDSVSAGKEEPDANAADVVDGGPGFDQIPDVDADYNRGFDDDVSVTVDGQANDGEAGEGDNVIAVEKLRIVASRATLVGSDAADDVFVEAYASTIRGLGGNDRLIAYDGSDTIEGGAGDDFLEGGFGNDVLDGGAGVDQFRGDRTERDVFAVGNDQIRARDGVTEQVNCGIGTDIAQVDASDVVDASCESVDRGLGPPGKPKVLGKLSIKAILSKGLAIKVSCPAACSVTAELRVDKRTARTLRLGRSRVLARGKRTLRAAGDARVTLKIVGKARKRFKRLRKAKVTLKTATTMAGTPTSTSRSLKLKR
jgi:hemolysin type calcium-binding protein